MIKGRPSRKTLVLASVDGSTMGDAGARRFARTAEDRDRIEAVIVLSNLAASSARGPVLIAWSNDNRRGSIGLQRTAAASLREELGAEPSEEGALGQFVRLAYPLGLGAQGPLLAEGIEAIRISGSGELPPPDDQRGLEDVSVDRLGQLGRSTLRLVSALDTSTEQPEHGPEALRGDQPQGAARLGARPARRDASAAGARRVGRRLRSLAAPARGGARLVADRSRCGRFRSSRRSGWQSCSCSSTRRPTRARHPPSPGCIRSTARRPPRSAHAPRPALLAWLLVRPRLRRIGKAADSGGAGAVTALALVVAAVAVWALNPFAALVLLPAVHLWMLAMLSGIRLSRGGAVAVVLGGLLPPLVAAVVYLDRLDLNPLEGLWYLWVLVTGHAVSPVTTLLACAMAAIAAVTWTVIAARVGAPEPLEPEAPRVRGPGGYAGPGSLGGTPVDDQPSLAASTPRQTSRTVLQAIFRSSRSDQFSTYQSSHRTRSASGAWPESS